MFSKEHLFIEIRNKISINCDMNCFRDVNGLVLCFKMSKVTTTGRGTPQPSSAKTGNENDEPKRLIKKDLDHLFVIV